MTAGSLAPAPAVAGEPAAARAVPNVLEGMWVRLLRERWSCLLVVAIGPDLPVRDMAASFARVARALDRPFRVLEAPGSFSGDGRRFVEDVAAAVSAGARVVVAMDLPPEGAASAAALAVADAALLAVRYGVTTTIEVEEAVERIGSERVMGAIAIP
jgi:hypothetical protein